MMGAYSMLALLFAGLVFLLIVAAIVALVVWAARSSSHAGNRGEGIVTQAPATGDRALDILRERYARGEITKEQYDQMRGDLGA